MSLSNGVKIALGSIFIAAGLGAVLAPDRFFNYDVGNRFSQKPAGGKKKLRNKTKKNK